MNTLSAGYLWNENLLYWMPLMIPHAGYLSRILLLLDNSKSRHFIPDTSMMMTSPARFGKIEMSCVDSRVFYRAFLRVPLWDGFWTGIPFRWAAIRYDQD